MVRDRYIVKFQTEDEHGNIVFDEITHNGMGFLWEDAQKLARMLWECDKSKRVFVKRIHRI